VNYPLYMYDKMKKNQDNPNITNI